MSSIFHKTWLPTVPGVLAFLAAAFYAKTESILVRTASGSFFGMALGAALLLWGRNEYKTGRIRGHRKTIYYSENPKTFYAVIAIKRFIPGSIMFIAGCWFPFIQGG